MPAPRIDHARRARATAGSRHGNPGGALQHAFVKRELFSPVPQSLEHTFT